MYVCQCVWKTNLIKDLNYIIIILFYINGQDVVKGFSFLFFNEQKFHNQLTNLKISKNVKIKRSTTLFHEAHITCYNNFNDYMSLEL